MWETLGKVLTSPNAWGVLVFAAAVVAAAVFAVKSGAVAVRTKSLRIGGDERERAIIRQQTEWAHVFIMSLESKVTADTDRGYFAKYILESVYDKVVEWITFNHITTNSAYIEIKQEQICALVYSNGVKEQFKTKEFKQRMCGWTRELIERLVQIREVYSRQGELK